MDNRQANINRFEAEMAKVTRDGVDKLMAFIRKSDMYAAPASTRFHLSVTGGLLQHSLNVLDALRANLTKNDDGTYSYEVAGVPAARVTEENVIIMALLHDICKTYFYTTEIRNRKVGGKWEQYEAFAVDDKIPYGHGEKSVMMIEEYMKLQPVECPPDFKEADDDSKERRRVSRPNSRGSNPPCNAWRKTGLYLLQNLRGTAGLHHRA